VVGIEKNRLRINSHQIKISFLQIITNTKRFLFFSQSSYPLGFGEKVILFIAEIGGAAGIGG
jgi:hypothetical protein